MNAFRIAALLAALSAEPALAQAAPAPDPHAGHAMPGMDHTATPEPSHDAAPAVPAMPDMPGMDHSAMPGMDHSAMPGMNHEPTPASPAAPQAGHDMANMPGMAGHAMPYSGVQGFYPMTRDASGTSWQPDASIHAGVHAMSGGWTLMGHALLNGVYDRQTGRRGDDKAFAAGMGMGAAPPGLENGGTGNPRAMLSPDPLMGPRGYPLLLAAGETADGRTTLVDRQHPHDLFMELSASYSRRLSPDDSLFVYAGLPGEPAFGPPAFMHRLSAMDSPEAPITHHWLDSTHITFGVLTLGYVKDRWKIEGSAFRGREPDQYRYNIEAPDLDSVSTRLSWNPIPNLSMQVSWGYLASPEQLHPGTNENRVTASAIWNKPIGDDNWASTFAWGRKML